MIVFFLLYLAGMLGLVLCIDARLRVAQAAREAAFSRVEFRA